MALKKNLKKILTNEHGKVFQIKIPATTAYYSDIREIIGTLIENNSEFSLKWKYRIQLVTDELINNAIEHGSSKGDEVNICVKIFDNSDIEITIEDGGTGKKKIEANKLMNLIKKSREAMLIDPTSNKTIRGRGLSMIVFSWSDSFSYENNTRGGLTAKIIKKFHLSHSDKDDEKANNKLKFPRAIKLEEIKF